MTSFAGVTVFQWKSYGEGITQNYPFNIDYDGETLVMTTFAPGWEQGERATKVQQVRLLAVLGALANHFVDFKVRTYTYACSHTCIQCCRQMRKDLTTHQRQLKRTRFV